MNHKHGIIGRYCTRSLVHSHAAHNGGRTRTRFSFHPHRCIVFEEDHHRDIPSWNKCIITINNVIITRY